jgi:tetratricopeptide (TPR) repeat protein
LRPVGHPQRAISCASLGGLLQTRYKQCADLSLLDEATKLYREALELRPITHPHRGHSYSQLATALRVHYDQSGNLDVLHETIILHRKALALRPPGHPDRPLSCSNLGGSLVTLYDQCGDLTLLDEAIDLKREALDLQPPHHPERASCSMNLGSSLFMRYLQCSDLALLDEAIALQRVALELQPPCHTELAFSHAILGSYLYELYRRRGDISMLREAIELQRKAIDLQPTGHAQRASLCSSLGISLHEHYHHCGDPTVLDDAIKLEREALDLRPIGHLKRAGSCTDLSLALMDSYRRNRNDGLLDEVVEMSSYVLENGSSTEVSRMFMLLAGLHLIQSSPHFSTSDALRCLDDALESGVSSIHSHISNLDYTLSLLWELSSTWNHDIPSLLCSVYIKAIDHLPLAAGFVLETPARLENLATTSHIGSDGCIAAVLAERPTTAIELLDRAHGLVWTQALHHRDPQMEGPPPELVAELTKLLYAISVPIPTYLGESSRPAHHQDYRHKKNTRIQALLREIRGMPGLERFMRGSTYKTLCAAAYAHPVVVLVAGRVHVLALVVTNADEDVPHVLHLELTSDELSGLRGTVEKAGLRSTATTQNTEPETGLDLRDMRPGTTRTSIAPSDVLATLWRKIVEPIISHLQLQVRTLIRMGIADELTNKAEEHGPVASSPSLVPQRRLRLSSIARGWHLQGPSC